jgi:hypothetical protein
MRSGKLRISTNQNRELGIAGMCQMFYDIQFVPAKVDIIDGAIIYYGVSTSFKDSSESPFYEPRVVKGKWVV